MRQTYVELENSNIIQQNRETTQNYRKQNKTKQNKTERRNNNNNQPTNVSRRYNSSTLLSGP